MCKEFRIRAFCGFFVPTSSERHFRTQFLYLDHQHFGGSVDIVRVKRCVTNSTDFYVSALRNIFT